MNLKKTLITIAIIQGSLMAATIEHIKIKDINIPIVFEEQKSLPTLNLQLVFKASGYIEDENKSGLTNLSAKLLNEGTKTLGSNKFASKLEENAISLSTSNGFETFVIELSNLKDVSKQSISLLTKLLNDPNLSEDTLDKLKTLQIGSLKRKENDFDYMTRNLLKKELFKDTSLENSNSGNIKSISKITLDDIKNKLESTLNLSNLIIVAGGDYKKEEFKTLIKPLLETLNKGKVKELKEVTFTSKKEIISETKETQQAYIYFGSSFNMHVNDKNTYKSKVASFILGGSGFGSRLMEEIRVKRGLAYSAYGYISLNKSHSYFTGYLQTKNESAKEAQELVSTLVKDFVKKGVTQEELDAAKNFLTGSEPLRSETLSQRLSRAFTLYYRGLEQNYPKKELEKIQNLKLEDLNEFIKEHKELNNLTFAIIKK